MRYVAIPAAQRQIIEAQFQRYDLKRRGANLSRIWVAEVENQRPLSVPALQARADLRALARSSRGRRFDFDEEKARTQAIKNRLGALAHRVMARRMNVAIKGLPENEASSAAKMTNLARFSLENIHPFLQRAQQGLRGQQVEAVAHRWTREVVELRGNMPGAARLKTQLKALQNRYGMESDTESQAYFQAARQMAYSALSEALAGRENAPRAGVLMDAGERFAKLCGGGSFQSAFYRPALGNHLAKSRAQLLDEIEAGRDNSELAADAQTQLRRIYALAPHLRGSMAQKGTLEWEIDASRRGLAHEIAYRIAQTRAERPNDRASLHALSVQLSRVATFTEEAPSDFIAAETSRLESGEPLISARQFRLEQSGQADEGDEQTETPPTKREPQIVARTGDPLLSLSLSPDVRHVEAITTSGETQNLSWNPTISRWETRFFAPRTVQGSRIILGLRVVRRSGNVSRFTLNLSFDAATAKTQGLGKSASKNPDLQWDLGLWSRDSLQRVSAVLPWQEKVALPSQKSGRFGAPLDVPAAWRGKNTRVQFLVVDKAQKLMEITVDWN